MRPLPLIVWDVFTQNKLLSDSQLRMLGETCKDMYNIFQYLLEKENYPSLRTIYIPSNELCLSCIEYMIKKLNKQLSHTISLVITNKCNKINNILLLNIIKVIPENMGIKLSIKNNHIIDHIISNRYDIIRLKQEITISLKQLVSLDLMSIGLSPNCIKFLVDKFYIMEQLKELNIGGNYIGDFGMGQLAKPLVNMKYLTSLNVESICIGVAGVTSLANMLKAHTNFIVGLPTDNLKTKPTGIIKLNLAWNFLNQSEATVLVPAFETMTQLTELNLNYNKFGPLAIQTLANTFTHMPQLKTLHLRQNNIGLYGATLLAPILKTLTKITTLDLGLNDLKIMGCKILTSSLTHLTNLTALDLTDNTNENDIELTNLTALDLADHINDMIYNIK